MLYTEQNALSSIRVREGKRVFYLGAEDRLTPSARDLLRREGIEILSREEHAPKHYTTLFGGIFEKKPEHMTHLTGNVLVPKDHPRIVLRGMVDGLEGKILLCQHTAAAEKRTELVKLLGEMLTFVRRLMRADVLDEPVGEFRLCGLDAQSLREQSHDPAKYFGIPFFMPEYTDGEVMLQLNEVRTFARRTELACYRAYRDGDGGVRREDMMQAYNRLSSLCWILMVRCKAGSL